MTEHNQASAAARPQVQLTVCVIGRNEAANLADLFADIKLALSACALTSEIVFVDSASSDDSVTIAKRHCDVVLELLEDKNLNAGAARALGTEVAAGDWILYLDGDMRFEPQFLQRHWAQETARGNSAGFFGRCAEMSAAKILRNNLYGEWLVPGPSPNFGGAVVLRRAVVDAAGGWNYGLFSNEELDLYVRIRRQPAAVYFVDAAMTRHQAPAASRAGRIVDLFWPSRSSLGKKYVGYGQHLHAAYAHGYLGAALRYAPLPFVLWLSTLFALGLAVVGYAPLACAIMLVTVATISHVRAARFVVIYAAMALQLLCGWPRYLGDWRPTTRKRWQRSV